VTSVDDVKKASTKNPDRSPSKLGESTARSRKSSEDELRPHYDLDYSRSRPNRFAERFAEGTVAVVLDPDVAMVFQSSEAVNAFLRSAISAMLSSKHGRRSAQRRRRPTLCA
jgi:hypothetical protein